MVGLGLTSLGLGTAQAREAKLVRYPHYHEGNVAFSYLGDIWTASEDGSNVVRLTANKARDIYPKFSPDGQWIAFSSDREGGLDVYLIPAAGGEIKRLTVHSADDVVQAWSPDSKSILFASQRNEDFMGKLYTVSIDGGQCRNAGPDMGVTGVFSPDGTKLAINRKAQSYWRKFYRGAYQSDVTVMDLSAKTFKDLTDFDGMDSWPMWSKDSKIYFVSDRDAGSQANIWCVPDGGGEAVKITEFTSGDVRFPTISADGKTIVFERDFGISKLDIASKQVKPLKFDISAETQESLVEFKDFNSTADDFHVAPNGKRVAVSVHGEIFTVPTEENGELRQITDGESKDQDLQYTPDGKFIVFVSDRSGREELYLVSADGAGEIKKLTDVDALKSSYIFSPDSKQIAFTTSDGKLYTMTIQGKDLEVLASSKYGNIGKPAWSPDGKWMAYSRPDVTRSNDIYLIPAAGGEEKKVTFDSASEMNPQFSADATKLYFVRGEMGDMAGGERPSMQLFCLPFEKLEKDPGDTETAATEDAPAGPSAGGPGARMGGGAPARVTTPAKEPKFDWAGMKRRTRQVTRMGGMVRTYIPAQDGKTLIYVAAEGGGGGGGGGGRGAAGGLGSAGGASIYTIQDDGKRMNRLASGAPAATPTEGDETPRGRGAGGFGGGISGLALTKDGRTLYFLEAKGIYSVPVSLGTGGGGGGGGGRMAGMMGGGGGGGRGALAAAAVPAEATGGGAPKKKFTFNVTLEVEKLKEWEEMFDDAWGTMKYRFYDPKMHGKDWDAMRSKYKPLVSYIGDRHELMNLINEMIGELNASHTGASAGGGRGEGVATRHLGMEMEPDDSAGKYKITHVYEDGPLDKDWFKVEQGNYLIAIDGKPLKAGDDYWASLGRRLNRKVELTINSRPIDEGSWKIKYEPIPMAAYSTLRYERWVKDRRATVDKLSDSRVGYLHIKAMDQPSLARFKKDLAEYRHKEALVIDQRWNGGGNIEQELLAILVQRPYQMWQPRGTEATTRPFTGYYGPKVVLQNWRSASNAEMFPAGFRALGLGKVVGTPTMGAVIGTGSYSLIDGSTVRTPGVGVFLSDEGRTNMENTGVKPDVFVENTPEDNLAGRDVQLEVGVKEVMKGLKSATDVAGQGQEQ